MQQVLVRMLLKFGLMIKPAAQVIYSGKLVGLVLLASAQLTALWLMFKSKCKLMTQLLLQQLLLQTKMKTVMKFKQRTRLIPEQQKACWILSATFVPALKNLRATRFSRCIQRLLIYRALLTITARPLTFTQKVRSTLLTLVTGSNFKTHKIVVSQQT